MNIPKDPKLNFEMHTKSTKSNSKATFSPYYEVPFSKRSYQSYLCSADEVEDSTILNRHRIPQILDNVNGSAMMQLNNQVDVHCTQDKLRY